MLLWLFLTFLHLSFPVYFTSSICVLFFFSEALCDQVWDPVPGVWHMSPHRLITETRHLFPFYRCFIKMRAVLSDLCGIFTDTISFDPVDVGIINISVLQMRKLRLGEVKELLKNAPVGNQWGWDRNLTCLPPPILTQRFNLFSLCGESSVGCCYYYYYYNC